MTAIPEKSFGLLVSEYTKSDSAVLVGFIVVTIAFVSAFLTTIRWVAGEWSAYSGALGHGYLVAAISIVLVARALPKFAARVGPPDWRLVPLLFVLSFVWLLSDAATVVAVQTLVVPSVLLVALATAFGIGAAKVLSFPLLYLYLAVPAWEHLAVIFQSITVYFERILVAIAGIPALIDGNRVRLSDGVLEIADGCSGLNFIVAGLALAILYSHLYYKSWRQWISLLLVTVAIAMLTNWIRVFVIIVIAHQSGMESPLVTDHLTFGWMLFGVSLVPVYFVAQAIEMRGHTPKASASAAAPNGEAAASAKFKWYGIVIAVLPMVSGPVWASAVSNPYADAAEIRLILPAGTNGWRGPSESDWDWQPRFNGVTTERLAEYRRGDQPVLSYTNLYLSQQQGRELVFLKNWIGGHWRRIAENSSARPADLGFKGVVAANYLGNWVIWYRYQVADEFETNDVRAKLKQALHFLRGRPEAGIIALATPCRNSCDLAEDVLEEFVISVGHRVNIDFDAHGSRR